MIFFQLLLFQLYIEFTYSFVIYYSLFGIILDHYRLENKPFNM